MKELENCICESCEQIEICNSGKTEEVIGEKCSCDVCPDEKECADLLNNELQGEPTKFTMSLYLTDEVLPETVQPIIEGIRKANNHLEFTYGEAFSPEISPNFTYKVYDKILIHLATPGGDVDAGLSLMNEIMASKIPVECRITEASSMGVPIALACHKRSIYKLGKMMIHDISYYVGGKHEAIKEITKRLEFERDRVDNFIIENSNITKKELKRIALMKEDRFMYPEECLLKGLVHEII